MQKIFSLTSRNIESFQTRTMKTPVSNVVIIYSKVGCYRKIPDRRAWGIKIEVDFEGTELTSILPMN